MKGEGSALSVLFISPPSAWVEGYNNSFVLISNENHDYCSLSGLTRAPLSEHDFPHACKIGFGFRFTFFILDYACAVLLS